MAWTLPYTPWASGLRQFTISTVDCVMSPQMMSFLYGGGFLDVCLIKIKCRRKFNVKQEIKMMVSKI